MKTPSKKRPNVVGKCQIASIGMLFYFTVCLWNFVVPPAFDAGALRHSSGCRRSCSLKQGGHSRTLTAGSPWKIEKSLLKTIVVLAWTFKWVCFTWIWFLFFTCVAQLYSFIYWPRWGHGGREWKGNKIEREGTQSIECSIFPKCTASPIVKGGKKYTIIVQVVLKLPCYTEKNIWECAKVRHAL